ncbi:protein late bloomer [Scaptodrosophila lebanonensis]|uniref:Tetraspanin n=1 Tax=Drosophila lebanonensis TaxID=7225 RepID=A0A6J2UJZ8_DROLE|nr:protein late bloomer [Scaptodrosophila lebanonensis]
MHCSTRMLGHFLCLINLICALIGVLLIWYGAWLLGSIAEQPLDHGENLAAVLCILLGIVVVLASIYGTVSVGMESKTMLISYAVLLVLLLIIQLIMFSISYAASRDALPDALKEGFEDLWNPQHTGNSTLNAYEEWLHCCGRNSAEDYFLLDKELPQNCCVEHDCTRVMNLYLEGCELKFKEYISKKTSNFNSISWILIITEFVGSVLACYLVDSIRNHRDRVRFYS